MNQSLAASDQTGLTSEARTVETISEQIQKKLFPCTCCAKHKKHDDKRELGLSRRNPDASKTCTFVVSFFAVVIVKVKSINLVVND